MDFVTQEYTENGGIRAVSADGAVTFAPKGSRLFGVLEDMATAGDITIAPYVPPTQAELDAAQQAEIDRLTSEIDTGRSIIRALGVEVYLLARAAEPSLNPTKFKQRIRDRIAGF